MMRKLFLLLSTGAFALSVNAQQSKSVVFNNAGQSKTAMNEHVSLPSNFKMKSAPGVAKNKTTATMSRWYIPFEMLDFILYGGNLATNLSACPIFFDSTVTQRFIDGPSPINYISVAQVIDPISNTKLFDDPLAYPTEMAIAANNAYTVDSVTLAAVYQRIKPGVTDTLIMSIGTNTFTYYVNKNAPGDGWAAPYIPSNDTLWGIAPTDADSVNRAVFSEGTGAPARILWKVPLTSADGDTSFTIGDFTYAVPGGFNVPANAGRISISFTFKSGDFWVPNVDSFNSMNNFRPIFGEAQDGGQMPYHFYDQYRDRNGSALMHYGTNGSQYTPSIYQEGFNQSPAFRYEFLYAGIRATCTTCFTTNVGNVNNTIGDVNAYPNPATNDVAIRFNLKNAADVNVTVSNTLGQVLKTQHMENVSNGKVSFSTADMANGVYFYTVESNGSRVTNRLVVAH